MPASKNSIARRIAALTATLRPADSLDERVMRLSSDERSRYLTWRAWRDAWFARHSKTLEGPYAALVDVGGPPLMPTALQDKLFPNRVRIIEGDTAEIAQQKYADLSDQR